LSVLHTSASLALNESWDPDVRDDMEMMLNKIVPEGLPYRHSCEGPDDMPAHVKACFLGSSLTIPITDGKLSLGTWQGVWLCEHRDQAGSRKLKNLAKANMAQQRAAAVIAASRGGLWTSHRSKWETLRDGVDIDDVTKMSTRTRT
ncbi:GD24257, partial [Drosophila simulans]